MGAIKYVLGIGSNGQGYHREKPFHPGSAIPMAGPSLGSRGLESLFSKSPSGIDDSIITGRRRLVWIVRERSIVWLGSRTPRILCATLRQPFIPCRGTVRRRHSISRRSVHHRHRTRVARMSAALLSSLDRRQIRRHVAGCLYDKEGSCGI